MNSRGSMTGGALLGRVTGTVSHGDKRGRLLGFPTANLNVRCDPDLPFGVYASRTLVKAEGAPGQSYASVSSYGTRPTFSGQDTRLETYILDFDGEIYGCEIDVLLTHFIRPELKFDSIDELTEQMHRDVDEARRLGVQTPPEDTP